DGTSTVNLIPEQTVDIANLNFFAGESKLFVVDVRFWSSTTAGRIDGAGRLTWCEDNAATIEYNLLAYISDTLDPDQDWTLTLTSQASATNAILGTNCNAAVRVSRR